MKSILIKIKKFDIVITSLFVLLLGLSLLSILTTSLVVENTVYLENNIVNTHLIIILAALTVFILTSIIDYQWFSTKISNYIIFVFTVGILILVLFSPEIANVHRWIQIAGFQFQPSEFAKISLIIATASIYSWSSEKIIFNKSKKLIFKFITYLIPIIKSTFIALIYISLILLQPSGGMALLLAFTFGILVIFYSNNYTYTILILLGFFIANLTYLFGINPILWIFIMISTLIFIRIYFKKTILLFLTALSLGLILIPTINIIWNSNIIKDYQRQRIQAYINPSIDPESSGLKYQQDIAVNQMQGVGLIGKGYLNGEKDIVKATPNKLTDFAYTVFIEENGIVGASLLHLGFILLFYKGIEIYFNTKNQFGKKLIIGILILILNTYTLSVLINLDKLFNTGIPTPFLSYGGSSLLSLSILLGILNSIKVHNKLDAAKF